MTESRLHVSDIGKENYDYWVPYNSTDIPSGNVTIGLIVNVLPTDYSTDVVWTVDGILISKQAGYTVALVLPTKTTTASVTYKSGNILNVTIPTNITVS